MLPFTAGHFSAPIVSVKIATMDTYEAKWKEYKRRKNRYWASVLVAMTALWLSVSLIHKPGPVILIAVPFFVVGWIAQAGFYSFRCPRCGGRFTSVLGLFSRRCASCGLEVYSAVGPRA